MTKIRTMIRLFIKDEAGVSAIEYGVLAVLIVAAVAAAVQGLGGDLNTAFDNIGDTLTGAG